MAQDVADIDDTHRLEGGGVIVDGSHILHGVQADPEDGALGNEVAPNMHIAVGQSVCAGPCWIQPQCLLQQLIMSNLKPSLVPNLLIQVPVGPEIMRQLMTWQIVN